MRIHEAAGFGELIGQEWLDRIAAVATGVRQEIPNGAHHEDIEALVGELRDVRLEMTLQVNGWLWLDRATRRITKDQGKKLRPEQVAGVVRSTEAVLGDYEPLVAYEIGNEINIDPVYKRGKYRDELYRCLEAAAWETERPIIAANVSNLARKDGMARLRAWVRQLDRRFAVGVHPYRTTAWWDEFDGYRHWEDMLDELMEILDGRDLYVTEAGWHDWKQSRGWGPFKRWTQFSPEQVRALTERDVSVWQLAGATVYTHFQARDAAPDSEGSDHHDGHFGSHRFDGTRKPVGDFMAERRAA